MRRLYASKEQEEEEEEEEKEETEREGASLIVGGGGGGGGVLIAAAIKFWSDFRVVPRDNSRHYVPTPAPPRFAALKNSRETGTGTVPSSQDDPHSSNAAI